jgi:hypothetical protein
MISSNKTVTDIHLIKNQTLQYCIIINISMVCSLHAKSV